MNFYTFEKPPKMKKFYFIGFFLLVSLIFSCKNSEKHYQYEYSEFNLTKITNKGFKFYLLLVQRIRDENPCGEIDDSATYEHQTTLSFPMEIARLIFILKEIP